MSFARIALLLVSSLSGLPLPLLASPTTHTSAASPRQGSAVVITRLVPESFSVSDGGLRGEVQGQVSSPVAVNVFAYSPEGARLKLSPGVMAPGTLRFTAQVALNHFAANGRATFFVSPSQDGSHLPSPSYVLHQAIELPAPVITAAVGGRNGATIRGTALRGARLAVTLAGQVQNVMANGSSGSWVATFANVAPGTHEAGATVYDAMQTFPNSATSWATVESEGDILRPLHVTSPPPGFPINRRVMVQGVATPNRGNVQVSLGGGPVVEASVSTAMHGWAALVTSPIHGAVPLEVTLPGTGEHIAYNVQVARFGDPAVSRFESRWDGEALHILGQGQVSLPGVDTEVLYFTHDRTWKPLATVQHDGQWRYEGPFIRDMRLRSEVINGLHYPEVALLSVRSQGDAEADGESIPMLQAAPRLTSSLQVSSTTTLSGIDEGRYGGGVKVLLPDGRRFIAPLDAQRRWQVQVDGLPLGRVAIEIAKDLPAQFAHRVATGHYVLEVAEPR